MKIFAKMVQHLYKHDVLSENAIVYWFDKGAVAQGRQTLRSQLTGFVCWLKVQEDGSDDEE
jgi:hypothetical protein